jgi:transcription-repair coupling factor (superfamily II helicase)
MDRPVLHAFVAELAEHEKLAGFAADLPQRARVSEAALPIVLASLHERLERPLVCLVPEDVDARDTAEAVAWFLGEDVVGTLPSRGVSWASGLEPPPHLVGERARALHVLANGGLVCASARGLAELAPPPDARPRPIGLRAGAETGVDGLAEQLALAGYARVERVDDRGQFAVRGGLIDLFPTTGREPLRVEFFGDEVESIRAFSPFTQRALHPVEECTIFPAAERRADLLDPGESLQRAEEGEASPVPDDLVPLLEDVPDFVFQPDDVEKIWDEDGVERWAGSGGRAAATRPRTRAFGAVDLEGASELDPFPQAQPYAFEAQRPAIASRGLTEAESELAQLVRAGQRVVVAFPHRGEALRTQAMLRRVAARILEPGETLGKEPALLFAIAPARRGFVWRDLGLVLLPDHQVFRRRVPRERRIGGRALQSFADLRTGDYVVHEDHGVAKLLGFETKEVAGVTRDYLLLGFRGEDKVYVPHEQLGKVSRYIGADAKGPALSKLGGKAWELLKSRARESVQELAGELIALYAQRQTREGIAYDLDDEMLQKLEASFPYRETPDQEQAIEAVKEDLERAQPMDRLVCGDVGFGKTEVAVRAAFAVAVNGKQVLMLAPTTILAEQHWNTFRERFRDFPVRVEMISRFRPPREVKQVLADFAEGKVDVLIGTHRVLSRDVIPKELGLVILDEEQRFGVAQKELLKSLRLEVDVLTLSATPIPRTLHMSLAGMRDISIIETPPEGRRPIRTTVGEYDDELVKLALEREKERNGQSFYLHNRVETIEEAAAKLQQLCPDLRFLVAHGQMREKELEEKMHAFLRGDADVRVYTPIIESGLVIPEAKKLVVGRALNLGH